MLVTVRFGLPVRDDGPFWEFACDTS